MNEENQMNQSQPERPAKKEGTVGPLVGTIIVILILVLGAFYLWNSTVKAPTEERPADNQEESELPNENPTSDNDSLEAELEGLANFEDIEVNLQEIDAEIDAAAEARTNPDAQ